MKLRFRSLWRCQERVTELYFNQFVSLYSIRNRFRKQIPTNTLCMYVFLTSFSLPLTNLLFPFTKKTFFQTTIQSFYTFLDLKWNPLLLFSTVLLDFSSSLIRFDLQNQGEQGTRVDSNDLNKDRVRKVEFEFLFFDGLWSELKWRGYDRSSRWAEVDEELIKWFEKFGFKWFIKMVDRFAKREEEW